MKKAAEKYFNKEQEEAFEEYKEISKKYKNRDSFLNAAFIAMERNTPREAVDIMNAAIKLFPNDELVLEFLGEAYLADGQFINAEKLFSQLLTNEDKKDLFYINIARAQMGMGEYKLAEMNFKTAAAGKSLTSFSNYMLGRFYKDQENWKAAAEAFGKVVAYDSQFLEARKDYADMLVKLKDYDEAWRNYRMVYSAEKNNEDVKKVMDSLKALLTKTEKELIQAKTISKHSAVNAVVSKIGQLPKIKVGLGTKGDGSPTIRENITFSPSHDFKIYEVKTNKLLVNNGFKNQTWSVKIVNKKPWLIGPKNRRIPFNEGVVIKVTPDAKGAHTIILREIMTGAGMTWASEDDKEYRGEMEILFSKSLQSVYAVNLVNIEEYLFGVISSEMPTNFPQNALRAQAVLARTYALNKKNRHKKWGYDVCDTQHCQVYSGVQAETKTGNTAIEDTMGSILTYNNKPIEAVYSSNCGGFTQSAKNAGWFAHPYLIPTSDYLNFDFENIQPYQFKSLLQHPQEAYSAYDKHVSKAAFRWVRVVEEEALREIVKKQRKDIGEITAIIPMERATSGYVSKVKIVGTTGETIVTQENSIKRNLSMGMLRSTYFIVQPVYENKKIKEFVFFGGGWGHGVGFCQVGSAGRAEAGQGHEEIVYHYYPGTILKDVRVQNK
ncbi:SpoIID/LytB domain protein [Elusimicrobium posterum]|uniref:SpoIID/LytB domain-containing protein n=1 Tax=Elusimicrobium posterum TaxID=3116653 RepID=UPI003C70C60C